MKSRITGRKIRDGFYKEPAKHRIYVWVKTPQFAHIEEIAASTLIGRGKITAWMVEEILKNEDLLRHVLKKIQLRPELEELQEASREYARTKRAGRRPPVMTACEFCQINIMTEQLSKHEMQCSRRPKMPALPLKNMEVK